MALTLNMYIKLYNNEYTLSYKMYKSINNYNIYISWALFS